MRRGAARTRGSFPRRFDDRAARSNVVDRGIVLAERPQPPFARASDPRPVRCLTQMIPPTHSLVWQSGIGADWFAWLR